MTETSGNFDIVISDLYDMLDNYNILAEPTYEEYTYGFVGNSPDDESGIVTDDKKT